ncbi:dihydrodipicolinate reductase, family protein, partial [Desulfovibrio sp. A2]
MSTSIIVTGAGGRMGSTICRLTQEDPALTLAAVVERPERLASLDVWKCPAGSDPVAVFAQVPGGVVVDFTSPEASLANARAAAKAGVSHVIGTTGLTAEQKAELADLARTARIFWAPNMSIGVNVLLKILPLLVQQLGDQ